MELFPEDLELEEDLEKIQQEADVHIVAVRVCSEKRQLEQEDQQWKEEEEQRRKLEEEEQNQKEEEDWKRKRQLRMLTRKDLWRPTKLS